ncbi:MAG TPA: DUF2155 domain-containing protein [Nitrospiraceae bacterium]|nr:DUF2155 domain-containing protein [Nitrospiraceae bacterium]
MVKFLSVIIAIAFLFSVGACKKKEEKPVPEAIDMIGPIIAPTDVPMGPGRAESKGGTQVVVPADVKGKWSAVKLIIEDKVSKKTQEFTVKLGDELKIPNSNLKVKVGDFLPDFKMTDGQPITITSASNNPNNPAVGVRVFEGDRQIFPDSWRKWGWLYANYPTIHPFQHEKYGLTLKQGVPKE